MTSEDEQILQFAAEHRAILVEHLEALLHITATEAQTRLAELARQGLTRHHRTHHGQPGHHQITSRGLTAIKSPLPEPRFETIRGYRDETKIPYVTLAARRGRFGTVHRVLTERVMRHKDTTQRADRRAPGSRDSDGEPEYGVPLGTGIDTTVARHYPDLMLIVPRDQDAVRVAVELQCRRPAPNALAAHIAAYGADPEIACALYLVESREIGKTIEATAKRLGLHDPTIVQPVDFGANRPATTAQ